MTTLHDYEINVGDTVFDLRGSKINVISITHGSNYPIKAGDTTYTRNGNRWELDSFPSLFWQPLEITDEQLKKAMTKPKKMVTKYRVIYKLPDGIEEYLSDFYCLNKAEFDERRPYDIFICLVKELSKEFEE